MAVDTAVTSFQQDFSRYRRHWLVLMVLLGVTYRNVIPAMVADWSYDPNYSHGVLVPFISAYFVWQCWPELKTVPVRPSLTGLIVIIAGVALLILGFAGTEYYSMRVSLVVVTAGTILFWYGWQVFRLLALPLAFLLFMVPLPYIVYDAIAFPLKLLVAKFSVISLKGMGIVVLREGNIIRFPQTVLEVADACSGLRSLMSLLALSVAYAFMTQKSAIKRTIIILAAVPIAIATNMFRVIVTGVLAQHYGAAAAQGFFHEFAGLAVFALAMLLLFMLGMLLRRWGRS